MTNYQEVGSAETFTYRVIKGGQVFISWRGKPVKVLSGARAEAFRADIVGVTGQDAQLIMAKATGNFKRGNEKTR